MLLNLLCARISLLEQRAKKVRDEGAEWNFLLEERNRLLMEKQDWQVQNATLQERNRIAREIHDNAGHMLSRCILLTGMIKTLNRDDRCRESLELLDGELAKTMDAIRSSVHDLHRDSIDLEEKVRELLRNFTFCPVYMEYQMGPDIPANVKYAFLAIVKEALTNVARHSDATRVDIRITEHPAIYQLTVADNGSPSGGQKSLSAKGSLPNILGDSPANSSFSKVLGDSPANGSFSSAQEIFSEGIGLQNIRDRAASLSGSLQIFREDGFRLFVTVPRQPS